MANRARVDRAFLRLQVAHVTVGGQNLEVLAEVFVDRLGLGRRFDDEQVFCHEAGFPEANHRRLTAPDIYI
jgi:hypothetical protein